MRRWARRSAAMACSALAAIAQPLHAEPFVACKHNRPGDAGLRVLVDAVHRNQQNTLLVQRTLGWVETPLAGEPSDVDELAWCRCVHRERARALGGELAVAMAVQGPRETASYERWLYALTPQQQREHAAFLFTSEARCFNASLRRK